MGRILVVALLCSTLLHCSKGSKSYTQVAAPKSTEQLGLVATVSTEQILQIQTQHPEAQIRALNPKQQLFEISHISENDLSQILGHNNSEKNQLINSENFQPAISLQDLTDAAGDDNEVKAAISTCKMGKNAPTIRFGLSYDIKTLTTNLGEAVKVLVEGVANPKVGGDVRILWRLFPPNLSRQAFANGIGAEQTFTPDSVGFYQIGVIAQGKDLLCSVNSIPLFVTANPLPKANPPLAPLTDLSALTHLTDVHAIEAWQKTKGNGATIAVIDTGLNYNHPAISNNIAYKLSDPDDNEDNDSNGFKNDFIGWDFINGDNLPFDDDGHGSHVSGLAASPLVGIAPEARIIPIKALNAAGSSDVATITAAIYYAADNGAQIINMSLGFSDLPQPPKMLLDAIRYAKSKNILILAAAGNGDRSGHGLNLETSPHYPASFGNTESNLIVIAATAQNSITSYSNFSKKIVALSAPGGNEKVPLFSLTTQNSLNRPFIGEVGTSMASPVAAGVAALVLSMDPSLTPEEVKSLLMDSGNDVVSLKDTTTSGRMIDAAKAVQKLLDLHPVLAVN